MDSRRPPDNVYDIDEDGIEDSPVATVTVTEPTSPMESGDATPSTSKTGKKRVVWEQDDAELAELRRKVSLALPEANGPNGSASATPPSADTLAVPSATVPRQPTRGVLRVSGTTTPQNGLRRDSIDNGISNLNNKRRSATHAQNRASTLYEDVSRNSSPTRTKPQRSRGRSAPFDDYFYQPSSRLNSGTTTPEDLEPLDIEQGDYVPKPRAWKLGGLSATQLMGRTFGRHSRQNSLDTFSPNSPGRSPRRSPMHSPNGSTMDLVANSSMIGSLGASNAGLPRPKRPGYSRTTSEDTLTDHLRRPVSMIRSASSSVLELPRKFKRPVEDPTIKNNVEDVFLRHKFLIKLCNALMLYGAPTHRLEEYMKAAARILKIKAQFLYIPGCMIVSFDDSESHTAEVKLVRVTQGIDMGKLRDTHDIYKEVIHDHLGTNEATSRLEEIMKRSPRHPKWLCILAYGGASACVGPFAFGARLIDLPLAFVLGLIVGVLQLGFSQWTDLYANVFEILAVGITSFLARWWGTLRHESLFCFPALAQSAIALILPGYIVLCGALELQSKSIVAGSVRLVYAIIYSLFLGFALTVGTAIYGLANENATSQTTCTDPLSANGHWIFFFVPPFAICLMIINQAKFKQMPVMTIIAFLGYLVSFYSADRFAGNPQVSSAFGSAAIAVMANLYSRINLDQNIKDLNVRLRKALREVRWIRERTERRRHSERLQEVEMQRLRPTTPRTSGDTAGTATPSNLESATPTPTGWRLTLYKVLHMGRSPPGMTTIPSNDSNNAEEEKPEKKKIRVNYSLAATAMLPAIFVQVPSGLSVSGSLVAGIATSDQIVSNSTGTTLTARDVYAGKYNVDTSGSIAFTVGFSVVQVAIGITVGLFVGTLIVYPLGKSGEKGNRFRRTRGALFSF